MCIFALIIKIISFVINCFTCIDYTQKDITNTLYEKVKFLKSND